MNLSTKDFLKAGFTRIDAEVDPLTLYEKPLILDWDEEEDEQPTLFFGTDGINTGFGLFLGCSVIWINATTPQEAVEFVNKIGR